MNFPVPPPGGSGPANYAAGNSESPFDAFGNQINYNNMARYQAVSQYQNATPMPPPLSSMRLKEQERIVYSSAAQYGVNGGQNVSLYNHQASMNQHAYAASMAQAMTAMSMVAMPALGGGLMGVGATMAAPMVPLHFVGRGIQQGFRGDLARHTASYDVGSYRDRIDMRGMSYQDSMVLGGGIAASNMSGGNFFNAEQSNRIHKIGLANDMINIRGIGAEAGSMKQYEKNFKELKETTAMVVKLMKTTIEGGMSVIKELQGSGFNSFAAIKQQVAQATSFGAMTGLGTQNMMSIGLAGAQSAQGTMWSAQNGATAFQSGAAIASNLSRTSWSGAEAVERAGGIANAGQIIGRFNMNVGMSGFGTRLAAYAMNSDGSVNDARMNKLMTGGVSAEGIVNGANATGAAMGTARVRFPFMKADFMNRLSDEGRAQFNMRAFQAWGQNRRGSIEDKAAVYAQMFSNDIREQKLQYEYILGPKGFESQYASLNAQRSIDSLGRPGMDPVKKWYAQSGVYQNAIKPLESVGLNAYADINNALGWGSRMVSKGKRAISTELSSGIGHMMGREGLWSTMTPTDDALNINRSYGLASRGGGAAGTAAMNAMAPSQMGKYTISKDRLSTINSGDVTRNFLALDPKMAAYVASQIQSAQGSDNPALRMTELMTRNPTFKEAMFAGNSSLLKQGMADPSAMLSVLSSGARSVGRSVSAAQERDMPMYTQWFNRQNMERQENSKFNVADVYRTINNMNSEDRKTVMGMSARQFAGDREKYGFGKYEYTEVLAGALSAQGDKGKSLGKVNEMNEDVSAARANMRSSVTAAIGTKFMGSASLDVPNAALNSVGSAILGGLGGLAVDGVGGMVGGAIMGAKTGWRTGKQMGAKAKIDIMRTDLVLRKYGMARGLGDITDQNVNNRASAEESLINNLTGLLQSTNLSEAEKLQINTLGKDLAKQNGGTAESNLASLRNRVESAAPAITAYRAELAKTEYGAKYGSWETHARDMKYSVGGDSKEAQATRDLFRKAITEEGTKMPTFTEAQKLMLGQSFGITTAAGMDRYLGSKDDARKLLSADAAAKDPAMGGIKEIVEKMREAAANLKRIADDPKSSGDQLAAATAKLKALETQLTADSAIKGTSVAEATGASVNSAPPVLNYWNNRWTL